MQAPKVSIGLPVYNGEKYLHLALDSILEQDYTDFELIISDNASEDGTANICRHYAEKDRRVRYHRFETNQGASRNFSRVFELARGEYFKWAAYDDICLQGFFRRCVETLDHAPASVVVVVPRAEMIDENGQGIEPSRPFESSDNRRRWPHQRLAIVVRNIFWAIAQYGLIRSESLRKTRLLEPFVKSDFALIAELALLGEIWELPEVLFQFRRHPETAICPHLRVSDHLLWFDPSKTPGRQLVSPLTRIGFEYARSAGRIDLAMFERLLCYLTIVFVWCPIEIYRLFIQEPRNRLAIRSRAKRYLRKILARKNGDPIELESS